MSEPINCTRCGDLIDDGYMIGDGDGTGRRFAHPECFRGDTGGYRFRRALEKQRDAAESRAAAAEQAVAVLTTAVAPVLAYLTAVVESADNQGHMREGDVRSDRLEAVNDVWLRRSDIAALAAASAASPDAGRSPGADPSLPPLESYPVEIEITEVREGQPVRADRENEVTSE